MTGCDFDNSRKMGKRVIKRSSKDEDKEGLSWYAFVPKDPEIFGHIIVTVEKPCIREIVSDPGKVQDVLKRMSVGIKTVADSLIKIDKVQRIYVAMLGESDNVHIHYHLFPRYGFISEKEIDDWATKKENRLEKGRVEWQMFYSRPTLCFRSLSGFQYLGEIENSYNEVKKIIGEKPSVELVEEMAGKIKKLNGKKE